jgi:lipid II isoglutaminyl synthase (glutamine-hydrolysing)
MTESTVPVPGNRHGPRFGLRALAAVWIGKCAASALRLLGREGTHVPGRIALWVCPGLLGSIARPDTVIVVTGTNGKTTTTNLLADALGAIGLRVSSNRAGSNLRDGIVATLISGVSLTGRCRNDVAVLEMDERSALRVLPQLAPDIVVCTNLTRDSIKRNAHPEFIAWVFSSALSPTTTLVLNSDDLITASLGSDSNVRVFYGVDPTGDESREPSGSAVDASICPRCDEPLEWLFWRFNHIGSVRCRACGFTSPKPDIRVSPIDSTTGLRSLVINSESVSVRLANESVVNVYNVAAVAATLDVLNIAPEVIGSVVGSLTPPPSRFADETVGGVRLVRLLTKGLVGVAVSRAFAHILSVPGRKVVLLAVDETTDRFDGVENTAWTYDADYEYLADPSISAIYVGGVRRHDQALRLAMAGVDPTRIVLDESETRGADLVPLEGVDAIFNLHSNHNAVVTGDVVHGKLRTRLMEKNS